MNKAATGLSALIKRIGQGDIKGAVISKEARALALNLGAANLLFILAANMAKYAFGDDEDKEEVTSIVNEHEESLNSNKEMTDKTMVEQKMKELQDSVSPIMSKLYDNNGQPGAGGMPDMSNLDPEMMAKMASQMGGGGMPSMPSETSQPTIDEVD